MNLNDVDLSNIETPKIAHGKVIPYGIIEADLKAEKEKALRKQQYRHDWLIAIFGVLGGGVMGFITSLVFWLIQTKQ